MSGYLLTVIVVGTFAYAVSLNMVLQNFKGYTKSNDYCRMQLHLLHNCVYGLLVAWSTLHWAHICFAQWGSDKEQRFYIPGQRNNDLSSPSLPHSRAHPLQEIMPSTSYVPTWAFFPVTHEDTIVSSGY